MIWELYSLLHTVAFQYSGSLAQLSLCNSVGRFVMAVMLTCGQLALANVFRRCFIVLLMRTRKTLPAFSYNS